ncbi:DNA mismatch repair endonuclease MutL [Thermomicrobium sp. CFH 73360]|uniref:DNA mismatch repair endonuclease MutL n=1 Tax=Thermomicrobium sp. CFH 73360 TaxID=2951987 RepID=UPI0020778D6F|nr:DNA mismatch repair endonuclease MutL [Thermomicrobium sp. CFH 73360]MCM8746515.1 DNA mismatch repair endonuclease MutL [Thermomicrobium sp. CFH 73360]
MVLRPVAPRRSIRILPPAIAARIAAGEVIERPASVVKELVENALDAAASHIRIHIRGAGLLEIRVTDDGYGIPPDELPLAVQRHATSKLPDDDLERIETLGFRGEALPSIAAVAELAIASATVDTPFGRRLTLYNGEIVADEPVAHPPGTTVIVRRLFENVPARLAATRNERAEVAEIVRVVRRLAIAAPAVRFALWLEDRLALQTTGTGELSTTLIELYGPILTDALRSLGPLEIAGARVTGLVSRPDLTRSNRNHLHIIVNGRWTQPRTLLTSLEAAYRPLLPRGRHPILALVINVDPCAVDVNIHPAKLEVRLHAEREIGQAASELLRSVLARTPRCFVFTPPTQLLDPLRSTPTVNEPDTRYDEESPDAPIITPAFPPMHLLGQLQKRLILLEGPDALYLVDQHRAHERILYERLRDAQATQPDPALLPEPILIDVRPADVERFASWLDRLTTLGFHCEPFGPRSFLLRAIPALPGVVAGSDPLFGIGEPKELGPSLLTLLDESDTNEDWRDRFLVQLACRTAVRRGRPLPRVTLRALVEALGQTSAPAVCPHGSPIVLRIEADALASQFRW